MAANIQFDLNPQDAAFRPRGDSDFGLWDCYGFFDDGHKCIVHLYSKPVYPWVKHLSGEEDNPLCSIIIVSPDGKTYASHISYPKSEFKASSEIPDVTMGKNRLLAKFDSSGKYDGLYLKSVGDGIGVELNYKVKVGAMRFSDREDLLTYDKPADGKYLGLFYMAVRCDIEGKLIINGKPIEVKGIGFNNYNMGNIKIPDILSRWAYCHIYCGKYSMMIMHSVALERHRFAHSTKFALLDGGDLIVNSNNAASYIEKYNIDPVTGGPYPLIETFNVVEGDIQVSGFMPAGMMAESSRLVDIPGFPFTKENPAFHSWQFSDVSLVINRGGKREKATGQAVREFGWIHKLFPWDR